MRSLRSTIVLLVILAGLIGYIYYLNERGTENIDAKEKAFASVKGEDIEEVQIRSSEGETSRVQKVDGRWKIVEPVQADADENELSSITSSLSSLDIQRVLDENAGDLAQ
jgi:hypothetical protein